MARIALVTDRINEAVETLALGLHQQRQEILLITGQDQSDLIPAQLRNAITVITPFKTWSIAEVARSLQPLTSFQPDIWHFVFSAPESRPTRAHWALAAFVKALPRKVLIASLLHEKLWEGRIGRTHLHLFDAITFTTRMQLMKMKREGAIPKHALAEVLLPVPTEKSTLRKPVRPEVLELRDHLKPYILIFGPATEPLETISRLVPETRFLFLGPRVHRYESLHFAPDVNSEELEVLAAGAAGILTAFGDFSVEELRVFWSLAERHRLPLIVSPDQAERAPGICIEAKTGWVLYQAHKGFRELLLENPNLVLKREASVVRHEFADYSLNQLVRLYHRAFEKRWA